MNNAPLFLEVLDRCRQFLVKHGLIDPVTGHCLVRYCWCSDGPFDIRDFLVKQCFISKDSRALFILPILLSCQQIAVPEWMQGDVLDVRMAVSEWLDHRKSQGVSRKGVISHHVSSLAETLVMLPAIAILLPSSLFLQLEIDKDFC